MKILQINSCVNAGSVGRHAENVGIILIENNHESYIAIGRGKRPSNSILIKVGNSLNLVVHLILSRLFDMHGLSSKNATKKLLKEISIINPDIVHLRNIHGYYLNYEILFKYLKETKRNVVWTFHDCWPITGHCSHFERIDCWRWQTECFSCPNIKSYPKSFVVDNSKRNYYLKKKHFTSLDKLHIITPSDWLTNHVKNSYFKNFSVQTIHNGIDLKVFNKSDTSELRVKLKLGDNKVILGVANVWTKYKGFDDILELSKLLPINNKIILIGMKMEQIKLLPKNIIGITHTESIQELSQYYSLADVFINPTYSDNFPTTNLESIACGTPVITYNTGGSPEAIDNKTGLIIEKGDINGLFVSITQILNNGKVHYQIACRKRAEKYFNKNDRYLDYLNIYKALHENS
jgi:putative colanic acid biosynthesis glycosyltransferase